MYGAVNAYFLSGMEIIVSFPSLVLCGFIPLHHAFINTRKFRPTRYDLRLVFSETYNSSCFSHALKFVCFVVLQFPHGTNGLNGVIVRIDVALERAEDSELVMQSSLSSVLATMTKRRIATQRLAFSLMKVNLVHSL